MAIKPPKQKNSAAKKLSLSELILFCRNFFYLLNAGLLVEEALLALLQQNLSRSFKITLPKVRADVISGESLSKALTKSNAFPPFLIAYITVGEETANLAEVFQKLAEYYEEKAVVKKEITSALLYPAMVMAMMLGVIILAMVTVLPGYARIFETSDMTLPRLTEWLMNLSRFIITNGHLIVIVIFLLAVGFVFFVKSLRGAEYLALLELKVPIMRAGINYNLALGLSLALKAGVLISDALPLCEGIIRNVQVKKDLRQVHNDMALGEDFSVAIGRLPYINPIFIGLAKTGDKTGALPLLIEKSYEYISVEYKANLKKFAKLAEPILTIVMGVLLAVLMLAVVLPTFELAMAF